MSTDGPKHSTASDIPRVSGPTRVTRCRVRIRLSAVCLTQTNRAVCVCLWTEENKQTLTDTNGH